MTEAELKKWIERRLGAPVLCPELTPEHLEDAVHEARHWFNVRKGIEKTLVLELINGQSEYDLPTDCDAVIDCSVQVHPLDLSLVFAPSIIADEKIPYDLFAASQSSGLYSSFVQTMQYNEMAKRVIGADFNWIPMPGKKIIFSPNPRNNLKVVVEYKGLIESIELLNERDHDFVKRYALAFAKKDIGRIRSKYDSMPSAQGRVSLDGRELLEEARMEMDRLNEEIALTALPIPIITG